MDVGAALHSRFAPLFEQIAANAKLHERERSLPHEEVRELAAAGFGSLRLAVSEGGAGVTLGEFFGLLVELAAADSNQPQIWRNHIAFVEDRMQPTVETQNRHWRELVAAGAVVGGAWSERGAKRGESNTHVTGEPGSWVVNGVKYYSTGSNFADWISVAAKGLDDEYLIVMVDGRAPGVEVLDDWSGFGQRTTGSGTARFTDVTLEEIGIFPFDERAPYQEAVYQLVHLATLAGIGRAAHRDVVAALQKRERAFGGGPDDVPSKDTHLQAVVGQVSALASAAEASVSRAANYLDVGAALAIAGEAEEQVTAAIYQAAIAVYEAQISVTSDVLAATTLLFDALGASALDVSEQLDRHWRNARTICSHNPRVHKERIVGDWYLNGTPPKVFKPEDEKSEPDSGKPESDHGAGAENGAGAEPTAGISDPVEQPTQPVAGTPR